MEPHLAKVDDDRLPVLKLLGEGFLRLADRRSLFVGLGGFAIGRFRLRIAFFGSGLFVCPNGGAQRKRQNQARETKSPPAMGDLSKFATNHSASLLVRSTGLSAI